MRGDDIGSGRRVSVALGHLFTFSFHIGRCLSSRNLYLLPVPVATPVYNSAYCQPTQNQLKSQFLFHKNYSLHDVCIMTLIVYIEIPIIDPYASVQIYLGTTFQRHTLVKCTVHMYLNISMITCTSYYWYWKVWIWYAKR